MYVKLLKYTKAMAELGPEEQRPDPLDDYLRQWGLETYISPFKEQAIDLETLQMLSESDLKELVPIIGHRAKLSTQIRMLKAITSGEEAKNTNMEVCEDPHCTEEFGTVTAYFIEPPTPTEQNIDSPDQGNTSNTSCELYTILNSTNEGKSLLIKYKNTGLLNNADRRRLCNVIIAYELKDDPQKKVTSSRLYELAYEIPKIFNKENSSVYFIPYTTITTKYKISAKGKLLDCYRQRRREFIKSGVISEYSKRQPSTSSSNSGTPRPDNSYSVQDAVEQLQALTEDVEDKILWLQNCCDPWETVETYWNITAKQRLVELTSNVTTVEEYIRKYKALSQPGGVFLLLKDFKNLYPCNNDNLDQNWIFLRPKIIDYARKRQDSGLKEILNVLEHNDTEEVLNVVAFMALPFLMTTSLLKTEKTKKQWRPSKLEVLDSFICHLKSAAEIDETIQRRKTKVQQMGLTFQPFIIIVGPSLREITSRYIILNHLRYESTSIVKSIDACFKIIFVLNAEYAAECSHVWQFIQKTLFNLNTKYDKVFTTVRTLVTDLGLELN